MSRRLDKVLIDAETAINTAGAIGVSDIAQIVEMGIYVEFSSPAAAGTVLIETASSESYAGTWAVLATVNWAAGDKCHFVALTGCYRVIRARISSAITSGTVTVRAVGNIY
jgi:hypothetical protein